MSDAEIALAADRPFDAASILGGAGDVLAELAFEFAGPGDELEAEAVVDHREAAGREREVLAHCAGDVLASLRLHMRQAGFGRELFADGIEFAPAQGAKKIGLDDDALTVAARQPLIGEMLGPRVDGVAHLLPEA